MLVQALSGSAWSLTVRQGFDEFMNLVIDDAVEVTLANTKKDTPEERRNVGQILLKGDNISLIQQLQ
jgi:small nuclear ribonucleoprotein E